MQDLLALSPDTFPSGRAGVALLMLRAFVGVAFLLHGWGRIRDISGFAADYELSYATALAAKLTQLVGGFLLIIGLLTPLAALGIATTMVAATRFLIRKGEPFINPHGHSWEVCVLYAVVAAAIALVGPGRYSVDAVGFGLRIW